MKNFTTLLCCFFWVSSIFAQLNLSPKQWQEDLRFLQKTVHEDYSFLFKKVTAEDFDEEVEKFYKEIPNLKEHEIIVGFARIVSLFEYGHTQFGWNDPRLKSHRLPLNLYAFKDGVFIQGVHKDYADALGAKVLAIEGVPTKEVLQKIRPVTFAENDQFFKAYGLSYISIVEILHAQGVIAELKTEVTFTLEKDGKEFQKEFTAKEGLSVPRRYTLVQENEEWLDVRDNSTNPLYLKDLDKIYYYEYLPEEKAVYVRHSQIQDDPHQPIPEFYREVFNFIENNDVEKLVLDVRLNGGGNNYKNKPIITGIIETEKINQIGKFFVIIGRCTYSACQNLVNELDNYTNAIFVGEPTAENINFYGDNRQVDLPNSKLPVYLSFAWWQDKPQWENDDWLSPDIAVEMSFEAFKTNKDPVLDAALSFSDEDFIINPMAYFRDLFMAGNLEELESKAMQMVNDPKYKFIDLEDKFNKAGYDMMGQQKVKEANFIFGLNAKLYPKSANAWDSYAESFMKLGELEKAKELYQKAIEMDPDGFVGDNARNMLKKMEEER